MASSVSYSTWLQQSLPHAASNRTPVITSSYTSHCLSESYLSLLARQHLRPAVHYLLGKRAAWQHCRRHRGKRGQKLTLTHEQTENNTRTKCTAGNAEKILSIEQHDPGTCQTQPTPARSAQPRDTETAFAQLST